jgi:hypothetical protein
MQPGNAIFQRRMAESATRRPRSDLAVSYAKISDVYRRSIEPDKALAALPQGQAIIDRLTRLSDNARWKKDLAWFNRQIAALAE